MEKYTLRELINNKEAQQALLEKGFYISATSTGYFGGMSYPDLSLQEILMAVFETIEEYGEDEVLERMFEAGGTCLTNDPKAAKSGVKPAGNSKKYFVKSNMGAAMKFSAILKAMMSYETHQMPEKVFGEPFSADGLLFATEPVNTEWTIWDNGVDLEENAALAAWEDSDLNSFSDEYNPFAITEELFADEIPEPPKNYSFVTHKGKHCIFDDDAKTFASLSYQDENGEWISFDSVEEYNSLEYTHEYNGLTTRGWKYRLEGSNHWGWISDDFKTVIAPIFTEVISISTERRCYNVNVLIAVDKNNSLWIYHPITKKLMNLHFQHYFFDSRLREDGCVADKEYHHEEVGYGKFEYLLKLSAYGEETCIFYIYIDENLEPTVKAHPLKDHVLGVSGNMAFLPATSLSMYHQLKWFDQIKVLGYVDERIFDHYYCAVKKDGYFALFEMEVAYISTPSVYCKQRTPFAFTSIQAMKYNPRQFIVEKFGVKGVVRGSASDGEYSDFLVPCLYDDITNQMTSFPIFFHDDDKEENYFSSKYVYLNVHGKKGVFSLHSRKFLIPCDYQDITYRKNTDNEDIFTVSNGSHKGIYNATKTRWEQHPSQA